MLRNTRWTEPKFTRRARLQFDPLVSLAEPERLGARCQRLRGNPGRILGCVQ